MGIGLLIIGDEILSGRRQDRHLAQVISLLAARGLRLGWAWIEGDDRGRLSSVLRELLAGPEPFFSCGGIGGTPDDHTRQAAAAALERPLVLHPEAEALIRARFGNETTPERLEMGRLPQGARIIPNPYNGIPGFAVGHGYFVPGFPVMAWPMLEHVLDTDFAAGQHAEPYLEASIQVFDAQESQLTPLMHDVQNRFGVTVFSLPATDVPGGRRQIELGAKGTPGAVAGAMETIRLALAALGWAFEESSLRPDQPSLPTG